MAIERQSGYIMFICDECGDSSTEHRTFTELLSTAKDDGWLINKDEDTGDFTHMCPSCVKLLPKL